MQAFFENDWPGSILAGGPTAGEDGFFARFLGVIAWSSGLRVISMTLWLCNDLLANGETEGTLGFTARRAR